MARVMVMTMLVTGVRLRGLVMRRRVVTPMVVTRVLAACEAVRMRAAKT